jgi:hypothetical protein
VSENRVLREILGPRKEGVRGELEIAVMRIFIIIIYI